MIPEGSVQQLTLRLRDSHKLRLQRVEKAKQILQSGAPRVSSVLSEGKQPHCTAWLV